MEKFLLAVMVVAVGVICTILLLSKSTSQNQSSDINLQFTSPTPSATIAPITMSPTPQGPQQLISATKAVITTSKGDIAIDLYASEAAKTVSNFATKAKSGFYKGLTFHRVEDWVVQGGDPLGNGTGGNNDLPTEPNQEPFVVGSVGVARGGDINVSNDAQFFITKKDSSFLNGQYTNFGIVTSGMDVVNKLQIGDKILGITVE